jgi:two-component sensor histidine kinase
MRVERISLKKIFQSSAFLALIPALLIVFFILPAARYSISIDGMIKFKDQHLCSDLNSDSITELIYTGRGAPYYYIAVKDLNNHLYDQWNLPDSLSNGISETFTGNYDNDNYGEIYIFTNNYDSLFLNINEMLEPDGVKRTHLFITRIGYLNGEVLSELYPAGFYDEDGDGYKELYFSISSAFRTGPRSVYRLNINNMELDSGKMTRSVPLYAEMYDTDKDNKPEIFGLMSASGNYRANEPWSDSSTWFMVYNDDLDFEFDPVEFPGFANGLQIRYYNDCYALLHWTGGTDTSFIRSGIMLFDINGRKVKSKSFEDIGLCASVQPFLLTDTSMDNIIIAGNKLLVLDRNLSIKRTVDSPFISEYQVYKTDINNDYLPEVILYSPSEEKIAVYNKKLKLEGVKTVGFSVAKMSFSYYNSKDVKHRLSVKAGDRVFFLSKLDNRYFWFDYLTYAGIYIFFLGFIFFVRKINTLQIVHRENLKQRLVTLQLQGIKSQLDPHFTFNTLNSVASLIYLEDREAAYDYLNKFTILLRSMLNDAERIYRRLNEELEFVQTYLELEKLRFGDKFDYRINIGEGITLREEVPKLVIQTFAENAVKHGILPSEAGGLLRVSVNKSDDYLKISIEDNGIGRERSAGQSTSTGKGLKLTFEFYEILNQINNKQIRYTITDLHNNSGEPSGTRVDVFVPVI